MFKSSHKKTLRATHFMGLSLYMILLAFFIALTATSEIRQDRVTEVMKSLQASFPVEYEFSFLGVMPSDDGAMGPKETGFLPQEQLEKFLNESIGDLRITEYKSEYGAGHMRAIMKKAVLQNYATALALKLKEIMANPKLTTAFDIEIIVYQSNDNVAFLGEILAEFVSAEFPKENITVILSPTISQEDAIVNFVFDNDFNAVRAFSDVEKGGGNDD